MELKPGYKETEVGVIPEDWAAEPLGPHVQICSGESPSQFRLEGSGVPYFKVEQLNNDSKYLSSTPYFFRSGKTVPRGSVIFPKRGASILLNKVRILERDSFMDTNLMTLTPAASLDGEYLYYALTYAGLWRVADTTSIPQINNKHIRPLIVPMPQLPEQRAIAGALGDVDALLIPLAQLIAKKRDLKEGVMQRLLTGQTRLPGFSREWKTRQLGHLGDWRGGATPSMANAAYWENGCIPWVSSGDIKGTSIAETAKSITDFAVQESSSPILPEGSILVVTRSGILRRRLPVAKCARAVAINQDIKGIKPFDSVDPEFLLQLLLWSGPKILASCMKAGTTVESIDLSWLKRFQVLLPESKEQGAIAQVLSDMDAELDAFEQRLAKTRLLKEGMMQDLLTGRTRLV